MLIGSAGTNPLVTPAQPQRTLGLTSSAPAPVRRLNPAVAASSMEEEHKNEYLFGAEQRDKDSRSSASRPHLPPSFLGVHNLAHPADQDSMLLYGSNTATPVVTEPNAEGHFLPSNLRAPQHVLSPSKVTFTTGDDSVSFHNFDGSMQSASQQIVVSPPGSRTQLVYQLQGAQDGYQVASHISLSAPALNEARVQHDAESGNSTPVMRSQPSPNPSSQRSVGSSSQASPYDGAQMLSYPVSAIPSDLVLSRVVPRKGHSRGSSLSETPHPRRLQPAAHGDSPNRSERNSPKDREAPARLLNRKRPGIKVGSASSSGHSRGSNSADLRAKEAAASLGKSHSVEEVGHSRAPHSADFRAREAASSLGKSNSLDEIGHHHHQKK